MTGEKESAVEAYFIAEVERRGGMTLKINVSGQNFWMDRLASLKGWGLFLVELKRPRGGRMSRGQEERMIQLQKAGAWVFNLWCRADVDELMASYDRAQKV